MGMPVRPSRQASSASRSRAHVRGPAARDILSYWLGLVLAAKSIARFPELGKSERFAEYFLIGTLLSLLVAIFGGIVLLKVLTGRVTLGQ